MGNARLLPGQAELPTPTSTSSYWHRQPSEALMGHRTTEELPAVADVVVVGSGITGAFAARSLVSGQDETGAGRRKVLMLEAREACWGATGRNGGHCQPLLYTSKAAVARFELKTFDIVEDVIAKNNIDCDWKVVGGVHGYASQDAFELVARRVNYLKKHHRDIAANVQVVTDAETLRELRVPHAVGAVVQPKAAKLWPYKLVSWLLEDLLSKNSSSLSARAGGSGGEVVIEDGGDGATALPFNLQTNTPVTNLQRVGDTWIVHTPRGQVAAKDVLLATNAYTSHLLPELTPAVVPVRGQVCALEPPEGAAGLDHSYVWVTDTDSDDYLIQRDGSGNPGPLILGGERLSTPGGEVGVSRDDSVDSTIGHSLRQAMHSAVKLQPPGSRDPTSLKAEWEWTGIMGYSADNNPWVGPVPESLGGGKGLWLSAAYTGHGMPTAAQCALRVVEMMAGKSGEEVEMPGEFLVSRERVEEVKARGKMKLNVTFVDELKQLLAEED